MKQLESVIKELSEKIYILTLDLRPDLNPSQALELKQAKNNLEKTINLIRTILARSRRGK